MQTTPLSGKKVFVAGQISCTGSKVYLDRYRSLILTQGAEETQKVEGADIVLIDTCAYNRSQEELSLKLIKKHEQAAKDGAKIIVCGCLAGINPERLQREYKGEFFSPKNENQLAYILGIGEEANQFLSLSDVRGRFMGGPYQTGPLAMRVTANLTRGLHVLAEHLPQLNRIALLRNLLASTQPVNSKAYALTISQGCLGNCSFCAIPSAKGRTTSLPVALIVEKLREISEAGVGKVILTSEDTGAYGADLRTNILELLTRLQDLPNPMEYYIHFFDPRWLQKFSTTIVDVLRGAKVRYLQLPLQSASDSVLERMHRGYRMQNALPVIQKIRKELPKLTLASQFISGFPGETDQDHQASREIIRSGLFDCINVFEFSERPGTAASDYPNQIATEVRAKRAKQLRADWLLSGAYFR